MAAPKFRQYIFPWIKTAVGSVEIRINKNSYDFNLQAPLTAADSISLSQFNRRFLLQLGELLDQFMDEQGHFVSNSFDFEVLDQVSFSGVSDGADIATQDLRIENKSLYGHIIDDQDADYTVFIALYNQRAGPTFELTEISYVGEIDPHTITSNAALVFKEFSGTELRPGQRLKVTTTCAVNRLSKKNIVVSKLLTDPNYALRLTDLGGYEDPTNLLLNRRLPVYAGWKGKTPDFASENVKNPAYDYTGDLLAGRGFYRALYTCQGTFGTTPAFGGGTHTSSYGIPVGGWFANPTGDASHLLNSWKYFTIAKLYKKLMQFANIDFDDSSGSPDFVRVFCAQFVPWDGSHYNPASGFNNYDIDQQYVNYHLLFGLSPVAMDALFTSTAIGGGIRGRISVDTDRAQEIPFYENQQIYIGRNDDLPQGQIYVAGAEPNIGGQFWNIVNVIRTTAGSIVNYNFDLSGAIASKIGSTSAAISPVTSYPVSLEQNMPLAGLFKETLWSTGHCGQFDINQTPGPTLGHLRLKLRNLLGEYGNPPSFWKLGKIVSTAPMKTSADYIKMSNVGDQGFACCPEFHGTAFDVPPMRFRAHAWGSATGIFARNIIFNPSRDVNGQESTWYGDKDGIIDNTHGYDLIDDGWSYGMGIFVPHFYPGNDILPTLYNIPVIYDPGTSPALGLTGFLLASHYTYQGTQPTDAQGNTLHDPIQFYANFLLRNRRISQREVIGVTDAGGSLASVKPLFTITWNDDDGVSRKRRCIRMRRNFVKGTGVLDFEETPPDFAVLTEKYPVYYTNQGDSMTGGTGSTGGTGGSNPTPGQYVLLYPYNPTLNIIIPTADNIIGTTYKWHSSGHSADFWQGVDNTGAIVAGVTKDGSLYSYAHAGFKLLPYGVAAGNTGEGRFYTLVANNKYAGFKAADSMSSNIIWTLPSTDGLSNHLLKTNGSAVFGFTAISSLVDAGAGILLSESGSHHVIIAVDTSTLLPDNCIIINPLTSTRNKILPIGDHNALIIDSTNLVTNNAFIIRDTSAVDRVIVNPAGQLFLGDVTQPSASASHFTIHQIGNTVHAMVVKAAASPFVADLVRFYTSGGTLQFLIGQDMNMALGDISNVYTSVYSSLQIVQRTAAEIALVLKQAPSATENIVKILDSSNTLTGVISPDGHWRTSKHISAGSITGSGADLHIEETTSGNVHLREVNNAVTNEHLLDQTTTSDNAWHVLHSWTLTNNKAYSILVIPTCVQTTNGNGKQWHGGGGLIDGVFRMSGGVITQIQNSNNTTFDIAAPPGGGANAKLVINGTAVELQVNGGAAETVNWVVNNFSFLPAQ